MLSVNPIAAWTDFNLMSCVTRTQQTVHDTLYKIRDSLQKIHQTLQNIHVSLRNILQEITRCLGQLCIVLFTIRSWRLLGPPLA